MLRSAGVTWPAQSTIKDLTIDLQLHDSYVFESISFKNPEKLLFCVVLLSEQVRKKKLVGTFGQIPSGFDLL